MKVVYLGIWQNEKEPNVELVSEFDLSSFNRFYSGSVPGFIRTAAEIIAGRTKPGDRKGIEDNGHMFYTDCRSEGICAFVVTDQEYPETAGKAAVFHIANEFTSKYPRTDFIDISKANANSIKWPELKDTLKRFQDPHEADKFMKIQSELDETKFTMHKTIESILERGEKIDSLVAKSDQLSSTSKMFYTQAKKQNSCCIVM